MKKFTLILLSTLTFYSLAQTSKKHLFVKAEDGRTIPGIKRTKQTAAKTAAAIQLIDSTLYWNWNTSQNDWNSSPNRRTIDYSYDANSNLLGYITQTGSSWNWNNSTKMESVYNANNQCISTMSYNWTWSTSTWGNTFKDDVTYNSHGDIITRTHYSGSVTTWSPSTLTTYSFNAAHDNTMETYQTWNGSIWENNNRYIYTYDANHNILSQTNQTYTNNAWKNVSKDILTYNSANILTAWLSQIANGSNWVNDYRESVSLDLSNDPVSYLGEQWSVNTWTNEAQGTFTCTNHDITKAVWQDWENNSWVNSSMETYTYNTLHDEIASLDQHWNGMAWENWAKYYYTYDSNHNQTSALNYSFSNNVWYSYYSLWKKFDANNFEYSRTSKYQNGGLTGDSSYTYYKTVVGLKELTAKQNQLFLYPNPNTGIFTLNIESKEGKIDVYNIQGTKVHEAKIANEKMLIDLSHLSSGVYMLKVSSEKGNYTGKLLIE